MRQAIKRAIGKTGFELRRSVLDVPNVRYRDAVLACFRRIETVRIAVVGANDGKINDPLYPILADDPELARRSQVLLIEPQTCLNPYLAEHYAFHPAARIENCVIGNGGDLRLYSVKESYWPRVQPEYARDWPIYRAPTGGTSVFREHVQRFVNAHVADPGEREDAVVETVVPSKTLPSLLAEHGGTIDVLQIDAEGFDDEVIYASEIGVTQPRVIFFEHMNLGDAKRLKLAEHLIAQGYAQVSSDGDTLAIRIA